MLTRESIVKTRKRGDTPGVMIGTVKRIGTRWAAYDAAGNLLDAGLLNEKRATERVRNNQRKRRR